MKKYAYGYGKEVLKMMLCLLNDNGLRKVDISNQVKKVPPTYLLSRWEGTTEITSKHLIERIIAEKIRTYDCLLAYNDLPEMYDNYLNGVTSIDAIVTLLGSPNKRVISTISSKYNDFFNKYLEEEEKQKGKGLYQSEGNDIALRK